MRRTILAILVAAALISPAAAHAQQQLQVSPASAAVTGGTQLTIRGNGFTPDMSVDIGGTVVTTTFVDANTLTAPTPVHLPGPSHVIVLRGTDVVASAAFAFEGKAEDVFEPVLLPIDTPTVHGNFGSIFETFVEAFNTGTRPLPLYGIVGFCGLFGGVSFDPLNTPRVIAPRQEEFGCDTPIGDPGVIVWVPKEQAQSLVATVRVADLSRSSTNFGTEIPIVRRADFRHGPIGLAGVPLSPQFRLTLRIYNLEQEPTTVNVRWVFGGSMPVDLRPGSDLFHPAYAMVSQFPGIFVTPPPQSADLLIEPADPSRRIWAFISVTNNETQHITVIAPN